MRALEIVAGLGCQLERNRRPRLCLGDDIHAAAKDCRHIAVVFYAVHIDNLIELHLLRRLLQLEGDVFGDGVRILDIVIAAAGAVGNAPGKIIAVLGQLRESDLLACLDQLQIDQPVDTATNLTVYSFLRTSAVKVVFSVITASVAGLGRSRPCRPSR